MKVMSIALSAPSFRGRTWVGGGLVNFGVLGPLTPAQLAGRERGHAGVQMPIHRGCFVALAIGKECRGTLAWRSSASTRL